MPTSNLIDWPKNFHFFTVYLVRSQSEAEMLSESGGKKLQKLMSFDMIEPVLDEEMEDLEMEDDELVFNEDFLEGITSCNKVENCVILSEFEQNLEQDSSIRRMRDPQTKKWFHKSKMQNPEAMANRGKKWNQVLPGPSKEMTTVLEETSTV